MKQTILFFGVAMVSWSTGCLAFTNPPLSRLAVKVVDESGHPITHAQVHAWTYWKPDGKIKGITDTNGLFRYEDRVYREIGYSVRKEGYYDSLGTTWWPKTRYQVPETNLVVELKRIINPVHMVRHSISTDMPVADKEVSFDLEVGDWTAPYGKGTVADISFLSQLQFETRSNFKVDVSAFFDDPLSGFLQFSAPRMEDFRKTHSQLMPCQSAPDADYEKKLSLFLSHNPKEWTRTHEKPDNNYIFRTRVATNTIGKIVRANYAWTVGDIKVDTNDGKRPWIEFTYYYNPDPNSRSLEPKDIADQQAKDIPEMVK